jgi:hypothetical protein
MRVSRTLEGSALRIHGYLMPVLRGFKGHALGVEVAENGLLSRFGDHVTARLAVGFSGHIWDNGRPLLFVENGSGVEGMAAAALRLVKGFSGLVFGQGIPWELGLKS